MNKIKTKHNTEQETQERNKSIGNLNKHTQTTTQLNAHCYLAHIKKITTNAHFECFSRYY